MLHDLRCSLLDYTQSDASCLANAVRAPHFLRPMKDGILLARASCLDYELEYCK
jgi:hypothetical protein